MSEVKYPNVKLIWQAMANEGRIIGEESDEKFHVSILGDDKLPPAILAQLRAQAIALGVNPDSIQ